MNRIYNLHLAIYVCYIWIYMSICDFWEKYYDLLNNNLKRDLAGEGDERSTILNVFKRSYSTFLSKIFLFKCHYKDKNGLSTKNVFEKTVAVWYTNGTVRFLFSIGIENMQGKCVENQIFLVYCLNVFKFSLVLKK